MNTNLTRYSGPFAGPSKAELCDEIDRLKEKLKFRNHVIETFKEDLHESFQREAGLENRLRYSEQRLMNIAEEMAERERRRIDSFRWLVLDGTEVVAEFEPIKYHTLDRERLRFVVDMETPEIKAIIDETPMPNDDLVLEIMRQATFEMAKKLDDKIMAFLYTPREED